METRLLIGGELAPGAGSPLAVENPATEETVAEVAGASAEQVDAAIAAAREAARGLGVDPRRGARATCCTRWRRGCAAPPTSWPA